MARTRIARIDVSPLSVSFALKVGNPDSASRVAGAFRHAIEVCSGKPSAF